MGRAALAGAAAVALVLATVVALAAPAAAGPTISGPASGASGAHIVLTGGGWPAFDNVDVYLDQGSTQNYFCQTSTSAGGSLGPAACTLPTGLPAGAYTLVATDGTVSASQAFTLTPSAHASGTAGGAAIAAAAAGQTVYLSGGGFGAGSSITSVKVGSTTVATAPAAPAVSSQGAFGPATFTIPTAAPAATTTVTVTDAAGHSATFTLRVADADVDAASPAISGRNLSISGSGWPGDETVYAYLDQGASQNYFCELATDASGDLAPTACAVPTSLPEGSYTLSLTDEQVTVDNLITLDPGAHLSGTVSGAPIGAAARGQTVYLTGSGFGAGTTITSVKVGTKAVTTAPAAPAVSSQGSFSGASFTLPSSTKVGSTKVTVTDSAGNSATLLIGAYAATVTAASSPVSGTNLAISGSGWPNDETVYAYLDQGTTDNYFCELTTDASGDLGPQACPVPTSLPYGPYSLVLTDEQLSVAKNVTLQPGAHVSQATSGAAIGSVAAGQTVYLSGSGFTVNGTIKTVQVGSGTVSTSPTAPVLSSQGSFSGTTFTVPSTTAAGPSTVTVKDSSKETATFSVDVYDATVSVAASGTAGTDLAVSGAGWPADDTVYAYLDQGTTQSYFCELTTDAGGALPPQTCVVPTSLPQGTYTLSLTDEQVTVTTPFTLNPAVALTNTSNQPITSAAPGATVDVAGSGFTASSTITSVKIGSTTVTTSPATPLVTAQGSLTATSFVVPGSLGAGSYTVTVTDSSGRTGTAPLAVT